MVLVNQSQSTLPISGLKGKIILYKDQYLESAEGPLQPSSEKPPIDSSGSWISEVFNHTKVRSLTLAENPGDGGSWDVRSYTCCQQFALHLTPKYYFQYFM